MKQSDILSFAINGVRRELEENREEHTRLSEVLAELQEMDRADDVIGRPAGFVAEPLINQRSE